MMGMMACMLWGQGEGEQWVGHGVRLSRPPVPFQPGLPQRHLRVPRQHLEGGSLPGAVHTQEAEALQGANRGYRQPCPCPQCHLSVCPALTSPGGMATQSRSTAGAFLRRYTCAAEPALGAPHPTPTSGTGGYRRGWSPQSEGRGRVRPHGTHLGQVLQQQEVAVGGGAAHPRPLPGHVPVLLPQRGQLQSPWPGDNSVRGTSRAAHPTAAPRPVLTRAAGRSGIAAGG